MANEGMTPLEIVTDCNRLIGEHRAYEAVENYIAEDFIASRPRLTMVLDRAVAADDMVVTHIHVEGSPNSPILVFMDIYRVENGLIVEHWDVMQPVPETNVNGRVTMY